VLSHPDPLLVLADIARLTAEHPVLDPVLIRALYDRLGEMLKRQPSIDEAREYVERLTTSLDAATLWEHLGLPIPREDEEPARPARTRRQRRPGRPGWSAELFRARYQEACARSTPPHSFRSVAPNFDTLDGDRGIDPDHLRKLARRFGLPPE